ncbi:MAG: lipopolysaccharide transport periplasmic protein LptA [bacterium]
MKWYTKFFVALILTTGILLMSSVSYSASVMEEIKNSGQQTKPVDITSSQLEANLKSHIVTFKGNVIAKQGDVILYCNTLTAYYDEKNKDITKIIATGDVKITRKDMIATGNEAVFDNVDKLLTLTGSPRVWQGKNMIEGTKIVLYIGTDKIFVEGAKTLYNSQSEGILDGQTP